MFSFLKDAHTYSRSKQDRYYFLTMIKILYRGSDSFYHCQKYKHLYDKYQVLQGCMGGYYGKIPCDKEWNVNDHTKDLETFMQNHKPIRKNTLKTYMVYKQLIQDIEKFNQHNIALKIKR